MHVRNAFEGFQLAMTVATQCALHVVSVSMMTQDEAA